MKKSTRFCQIKELYDFEKKVKKLDLSTFKWLCAYPDQELSWSIFRKREFAGGIFCSFDTLQRSPLSKDREIYLAVCDNTQIAAKISSGFCYLNDGPLRGDREVYLAVCRHAQYADNISSAFCYLNNSPMRADREIYLAVCAGAPFDDNVYRAFRSLNDCSMGAAREMYLAVCANGRYAGKISDAFSILNDSPLRDDREIYLAVCTNAQYADKIFSAFWYLNESLMRENREIYLAVCANAQYADEVSSFFCYLNTSSMREDREIYLAVCANAQYADTISSTFSLLKDCFSHTHREKYLAVCASGRYALKCFALFHQLNNSIFHADQEIYLAVCDNAQYADKVSDAFSTLKNSVMRDDREIYLLVCEKAKYGNANQIAQAFVAFHQIGYLTHSLIDLICHNTDDAHDIAALSICLEPIGLLSYLKKAPEIIFNNGQYAKNLKPLFELMIKADLFRRDEWYEIVLGQKIPENIKNIIMIDHETKILYHFDENGNKTEILDEVALRPINLSYWLTKKIHEGEIENISSDIDYNTRIIIQDIVRIKVGKISSDNRQFNIEMVCQHAKYAENIFPLLQRLDSVGLLFQFIIVLAFENAQYSQLINEIFRHLNSLDILNKSNGEKILQKGKYAERILTALETLYTAGLNKEGLYQKDTVQLICEYPEYGQNIVSLLTCLGQVNISLNDDNLREIARTVKYSAGIFSACRALCLGNSLTQNALNLIFVHPKQAIFIAIENGGILEENNDGFEDFKNARKVCTVFRKTGAGLFFGAPKSEESKLINFEHLTEFCFLPKEVLHNIVSQSGNNTLDEETREEIIHNALCA